MLPRDRKSHESGHLRDPWTAALEEGLEPGGWRAGAEAPSSSSLKSNPGSQYSSLLPKLVQVMGLNLETKSNQKGFQSPNLGFLDGRGEGPSNI